MPFNIQQRTYDLSSLTPTTCIHHPNSLSPPGQLFLHSVVSRTLGDALRIPCQNRARQRARLEVLLQARVFVYVCVCVCVRLSMCV